MAKKKPTYKQLEQQLTALESALEQNKWLNETRLWFALPLSGTGLQEMIIETNEHIWDKQVYEFWGLPEGTPVTYGLFLQGIHPDDRELVQKHMSQVTHPKERVAAPTIAWLTTKDLLVIKRLKT